MNTAKHWWGVFLAAAIAATAAITGCGDRESKYKQASVKKGDLYEKVSVRGHFDSLTDANVTNLQQFSLVVEVLVDEGDRVKKGDVMAKLSSRDRENLINTAASNLENLQRQADAQGGADEALARQIKVAERELAFAREEYQIVPVLAPLDGVVSARRIDEGESAYTNQTMFVLRDRLIVTCDVNESDIAKVRIGQTVAVVPDAYPGKKSYGRVSSIANYGQSRQAAVNFEVKSELFQPDSVLKLGMSADVDIIIAKAMKVLYIPVEFVQFEPKDKDKKGTEEKGRSAKKRGPGSAPGKRNYSRTPEWEKKEGTTFVLTGDEKKPKRVDVETGFTNNIQVAITEGLEEGDKVFLKREKKKKEKWK